MENYNIENDYPNTLYILSERNKKIFKEIERIEKLIDYHNKSLKTLTEHNIKLKQQTKILTKDIEIINRLIKRRAKHEK